MGVAASLEYRRGYPPLANRAEEAAMAGDAAAEIVGEADVDRDPSPMMVAEDFAFLLQAMPGAYILAYILMGIGRAEEGSLPHTPIYDVNGEALPIGASYRARLVERLLPRCVPGAAPQPG